jgi:small subunit ribosomal protein S4
MCLVTWNWTKNKMEAKVNSVIEREWVALNVNELLVVEYYSRKA